MFLQRNRAAFNQYTVAPTCKLCTVAPETKHFLSECSVFVSERQELKKKKNEKKTTTRYCQINWKTFENPRNVNSAYVGCLRSVKTVWFPVGSPGLHSEVQFTRECLALDPCPYWLSSLGTGIQGKTFNITLHYWKQPRLP